MKALCVALWACVLAGAPSFAAQEDAAQARLAPSALLESFGEGRAQSQPMQHVRTGLKHLEAGELAEASREFNAALQLDPSRSYVQLLNGLTYHLMAVRGDADKFALAEQGYQLAISFDRSNYLARYFRGNLHLDRRQFRAAQADFAEALLFAGSDPEILHHLAGASYLAGDPATAAGALDRLLQLDPGSARGNRTAAVVYAAVGRHEDARRALARYQAHPASRSDSRLAENRMQRWESIHRRGGLVKVQTVAPPDAGGQSLPQVEAPAQSPGSAPPEAQPATDSPAPPDMAPPAPESSAPPPGGREGERMVLVDVVIVRTEDSISTRKGTNLLSALTLQFGGSSVSTDVTGTMVNVLTRSFTIPSLNYSLNIANASSDSNEILARPTLAALEGQKSNFFSGSAISAAVVASSVNSVGGSVQVEKEIGVRLELTPFFLDGNRVKLLVAAERTFLKPPSKDINFTYKLETSKTTVNAQVVMEFGETVILSGLSEKETSRIRDGVPGLQDVPIVQYAFSQSDTRDFQRSVLVLLTPRRSQYVYRSKNGQPAQQPDDGGGAPLEELRARYSDWFRPYPNLASVFHHLGSSSLYREFRTGDVTLERWDRQTTLDERLRQAVGFLYY